MNDREIDELEKMFEREVDGVIARDFGPEPTVAQLHGLAQQMEEVADSYGADPVRYLRAGVAWDRAFDAAERAGGASLKERYAASYGWHTPVEREAREARGQLPEEVHVVDSRKGLYELDFDEVVDRYVPVHLRPDRGFGYEL